MSLSTSAVSTAIPVIADKTQARLRLTSLDVQEKEGGSDSLKFVFELTHPVPDTQGSTIHPGGLGSKVVEFIPLVAKPDALKYFFRYFNIFGPRQDPGSPYSGVLAKFIPSMLCGEPPTI